MHHVLPSPAARRARAPWGTLAAIETSSITVHADEVAGRCFIDVFSCCGFDPAAAAAVAQDHFGGRLTLRVLER